MPQNSLLTLLSQDWPGGPPVYVNFYFFNITNVKDVLKGKQPIVNETGPYVYRYIATPLPTTFALS